MARLGVALLALLLALCGSICQSQDTVADQLQRLIGDRDEVTRLAMDGFDVIRGGRGVRSGRDIVGRTSRFGPPGGGRRLQSGLQGSLLDHLLSRHPEITRRAPFSKPSSMFG